MLPAAEIAPLTARAVPQALPRSAPPLRPVRPVPPDPKAWGPRLVARHGPIIQRWGEMAPAALTGVIISALFWAPLVAPWLIALFVLAFNLNWLGRSIRAAYYGVQGFRRLRQETQTDWRRRYETDLDERRMPVAWESVYHVVVIPNFNERIEKLRLTLEHLAQQEWVAHQIIVVLAMEAREHGAAEKARQLQKEFTGRFAHIFFTLHPVGLPGEVPGKSSNEDWAARWAKRYLVDELGYDLDALTITSCDADSLFHPRYFSALTYQFCTDPQRYRAFWQSPIFLYNNIWQVPSPTRLVSILSTVNFLADLANGRGLVFPQSTYSLSMRMADEVGYWDGDVIPEDWHMFLKCFFALGGEVRVAPIFLPTGSDAVYSGTYWGSLVTRYKQAKRHAWGAIDIPYTIQQFLLHPEVSVRRKAQRLWAVTENHLVWSTHWFVLSLGGTIPATLAPELNAWGIVPGGLPTLVSLLLTACLVPFVVVIWLDAQMRPSPPEHLKGWQVAAMHLQWFLLPVTSLVFSALPALDAQTQMFRGKPLVYQVTEKA
ncbi:MAG: glycosyltransferase family 2 protein [Chloroflexi bacterium]|nr:glycosyltransferase family 2 protein [Chloroflexota bacterium]